MTGTTPSLRSSTSSRAACSASKQSLAMQEQGQASRREVLGTAFAAGLTTLLPGRSAEAAGLAFGYGTNVKDIDAQLSAFGLKSMGQVPNGFKPLIQAVGGSVGANVDGSKIIDSIGSIVTDGGLKTGERLLLLFSYPSAWIVSLPTLTANGESGTVSANNYVKGDSAVVNARNLKDPSAPLSGYDTKFFEDLFLQQVAPSQQQGFKVVKKKAAEAIEGQETIDVEYRYDLLINGVPIGRHGFAKVVKVGNSAVSLGATTTDSRFKGMKEQLITCANTFRAHTVKAEFEKSKSGVSINTDIKNDDGL